jgi:hypothetical protein
VSIAVCLAGSASFVWLQFFRRPGPEPSVGAGREQAGPRMAVPRERVRPRR